MNTSETIAKNSSNFFKYLDKLFESSKHGNFNLILIKKKKCIFTSRSKIDFKADTRKSKLISCRSNILFEKGEKFSKFSKFSLEEERSKFTTKIYFSIRANWTSCIISNFLFPRISWQGHLSKRERERNRGRKRKLLRKVRWNSHCRSKISNVLDREESLT